MRPVMRGRLHYESLFDTKFGLEDIARLNDALDVQDENEARYHEAQK